MFGTSKEKATCILQWAKKRIISNYSKYISAIQPDIFHKVFYFYLKEVSWQS